MRMKQALVAAASGVTLVLAGPATGAFAAGPELKSEIAQELRGDLGDLGDVNVLEIDLSDLEINIQDVLNDIDVDDVIEVNGDVIEIDVDNLNVVALNDIVVEVLNDLDVNIEDVDVDVDIEDNVVVVDVEILD
jgi:hypothetical protein